jgi:hypothetical protein
MTSRDKHEQALKPRAGDAFRRNGGPLSGLTTRLVRSPHGNVHRLAMVSARALHPDGLEPRNKGGILMENCVESCIENFAIPCGGATRSALQ